MSEFKDQDLGAKVAESFSIAPSRQFSEKYRLCLAGSWLGFLFLQRGSLLVCSLNIAFGKTHHTWGGVY